MKFDSYTVRSIGNAYFSADFATNSGDCFIFAENTVPNIVSFSPGSNCAASGHTCRFEGQNYKIVLNSNVNPDEEIAITDFNFLEYALTDVVSVSVDYYAGCSTLSQSFLFFIETSFTIEILSNQVTIQSSSNVAGET